MKLMVTSTVKQSLNGKLNGQRVNGEATMEPTKIEDEDGECEVVQFRLTETKK